MYTLRFVGQHFELEERNCINNFAFSVGDRFGDDLEIALTTSPSQ